MLAEDLRSLQGQGNCHVTQKDKKQARAEWDWTHATGRELWRRKGPACWEVPSPAGRSARTEGERQSLSAEQGLVCSGQHRQACSDGRCWLLQSRELCSPGERAWGETGCCVHAAWGAAGWCDHTPWSLRKNPKPPQRPGTTVQGARGGSGGPTITAFLPTWCCRQQDKLQERSLVAATPCAAAAVSSCRLLPPSLQEQSRATSTPITRLLGCTWATTTTEKSMTQHQPLHLHTHCIKGRMPSTCRGKSQQAPILRTALPGLPWLSSSEGSALPMQGARVQSLVSELDPTCYN